MKGNSADQDASQAKKARIGHGFNDGADFGWRGRQICVANQGRDQFSPGAEIGFEIFEVLYTLADFRVCRGPDIAAHFFAVLGGIKIPWGPLIGSDANEPACQREIAFERRVEAALRQFGIEDRIGRI